MVKNAVPCLGQLLAAHNPADWPSAIRPFNLLLRCAGIAQGLRGKAADADSHAQVYLVWSDGVACCCNVTLSDVLLPSPLSRSLCLDGRAKVRRAAQSAVGDVLAGLQAAPAGLGQASEEVLKLCQRVLPGPEAAAHAAAAAPSKKRQQAEEAIAAAVADALHLLGALKQWLPLLSSEWAGGGCRAAVEALLIGK